MKNINEILAEAGVEIPQDKLAGFNKAFNENYKTISEFDKKVQRLETERDGYKEQLDTANESLKGFEGLDVEDLKKQIADAQKRAKDAEDDYNKKISERDFDEALKAEMSGFKFTSKAAEQSVLGQIKEAGLKVTNGKILGLSDLINTIKATDADAFVDDDSDDKTPPPARFTQKIGSAGTGKRYTSREEIMNIRNASERQAAIEANMNLFTD